MQQPSVLYLIIANCIPLIGALFFDWELFQIIFLYWLENAVIGFFNVLKMIKVSNILSVLLVPFFIIHYTAFMISHLILIMTLFTPEFTPSSFLPSLEIMVPLLKTVALPFTILFLSHGTSFLKNFINAREFEYTSAEKLMRAPYRRIILMHFTVILGGGLIIHFGEPVLGIALLIILKIVTDVRSHIKEHRFNLISTPTIIHSRKQTSKK